MQLKSTAFGLLTSPHSGTCGLPFLHRRVDVAEGGGDRGEQVQLHAALPHFDHRLAERAAPNKAGLRMQLLEIRQIATDSVRMVPSSSSSTGNRISGLRELMLPSCARAPPCRPAPAAPQCLFPPGRCGRGAGSARGLSYSFIAVSSRQVCVSTTSDSRGSMAWHGAKACLARQSGRSKGAPRRPARRRPRPPRFRIRRHGLPAPDHRSRLMAVRRPHTAELRPQHAHGRRARRPPRSQLNEGRPGLLPDGSSRSPRKQVSLYSGASMPARL